MFCCRIHRSAGEVAGAWLAKHPVSIYRSNACVPAVAGNSASPASASASASASVLVSGVWCLASVLFKVSLYCSGVVDSACVASSYRGVVSIVCVWDGLRSTAHSNLLLSFLPLASSGK